MRGVRGGGGGKGAGGGGRGGEWIEGRERGSRAKDFHLHCARVRYRSGRMGRSQGQGSGCGWAGFSSPLICASQRFFCLADGAGRGVARERKRGGGGGGFLPLTHIAPTRT